MSQCTNGSVKRAEFGSLGNWHIGSLDNWLIVFRAFASQARH